jgi:hypothetical protein
LGHRSSIVGLSRSILGSLGAIVCVQIRTTGPGRNRGDHTMDDDESYDDESYDEEDYDEGDDEGDDDE